MASPAADNLMAKTSETPVGALCETTIDASVGEARHVAVHAADVGAVKERSRRAELGNKYVLPPKLVDCAALRIGKLIELVSSVTYTLPAESRAIPRPVSGAPSMPPLPPRYVLKSSDFPSAASLVTKASCPPPRLSLERVRVGDQWNGNRVKVTRVLQKSSQSVRPQLPEHRSNSQGPELAPRNCIRNRERISSE